MTDVAARVPASPDPAVPAAASVSASASASEVPDLPEAPAARRTVIDVRDLGVRYSLRFTKKTTLRQSFTNLFRRDDRPTDFWALENVTFRLVHGESLAVIGPNGAG